MTWIVVVAMIVVSIFQSLHPEFDFRQALASWALVLSWIYIGILEWRIRND